MSAEDEAWDVFYETMGARCCDCPSCNHYLPEGEFKPESTCVMVAAIERVIAARLADVADWASKNEIGEPPLDWARLGQILATANPAVTA